MKKNIFLFALLFITASAFAQPAEDSYYNGILLKTSEKYDEALAAFKKTISLDANYMEAYYQAGWCSNTLEKYKDALGFLDKYKPGKDADLAYKYVEMGYANYKLDNVSEALAAYKKSLGYHPNYDIAYLGLANVYYEDIMEYENAIYNYELAIKYDDENDEQDMEPYYYKLGWLYNIDENYEKAETILKKAVVYDPKSVNAAEELAYAYLKLNKFNDGVLQAKNAIHLNPKSTMGYRCLVKCYIGLNEKDKAIQAYTKLKSFDEAEAAKLLQEIGN